jgi:hypothetical protein
LAYTERDSPVLTTAALHSGCFHCRQYCCAIGHQSGAEGRRVDRQDPTRRQPAAATNIKLYHLCSRPFYSALGEADNRNRRERPPFAIKNRLMSLDFVLANRKYTCLSTESEKVDFFSSALGIDRSNLAVKRFVSQQSKEATARYFADNCHIFIARSEKNLLQEVSFC